ncbi:MAG: hypothetical protein ACI9EP_001765 [Oceanospirillaceae bacterium]
MFIGPQKTSRKPITYDGYSTQLRVISTKGYGL